MTEPFELNDADLVKAKDWAMATYMRSYVDLMRRQLGIEATSESMNDMAVQMLEPLNIATEAVWRALVNDKAGCEKAVERFKEALSTLA